jgi:hypothetical protein
LYNLAGALSYHSAHAPPLRHHLAPLHDGSLATLEGARNHGLGTIDEIHWGDVLVHVTMGVGNHIIESVLRAEAPRTWR